MTTPVNEAEIRAAVQLLQAIGVCFSFEACLDVDEDDIVEMAKDYEAFAEKVGCRGSEQAP